ncbi:MAG: hypothetical protein HQ536_00985 [Parcubacteria group bacterium]|nr:hypothetical protein [Parcubacteria group bacterium]
MQKIYNLFDKLGLNQKEAKVYMACLELGSGTVKELSEKSGVKRTSIYNFLEELKQKGLITEIKRGKKTMLVAEDPKVLKLMAKERMQDAEEYVSNIDQIIPNLVGLFNLPANKPKVKYYQGIKGIKQIYEDTLREHSTIYAFSDYEKMLPVMDFDYMVDYADRRAKQGIQILSIAAPNGPWTKKAIKLNKKQKRQIKVAKKMQFDTEINIYGNKVALLSFRRPYAGTIIEDRAIVQTLKNIWEFMWEKL